MGRLISERTRCYSRIKRMPTRGKAIQGGAGAGKTYAITQTLNDKCLSNVNHYATILGPTYQKLKDGPIKDAKNILTQLNYDANKMYNQSAHDIKYKSGSELQFRHLKNYEEHQGKSMRRDTLYILEANNFSWDVVWPFIQRTDGDIFIDYNPDTVFWAHEELPKLRNQDGSKMFSRIITTYQDNHMLGDNERNAILSRQHDTEWFRVYGLGLTGVYSERQIYNFDTAEQLPVGAELVNYGLDFGYFPDKTSLVANYVKGYDLYPILIFSKNNLNDDDTTINGNETIANEMAKHDIDKSKQIFADTSNPKAIRNIKDNGYDCKLVFKTLVLDGIKSVKKYNLKLVQKEMIDPARAWLRKIDKLSGRILPEPAGHEPDELASMRYGVMSFNLVDANRRFADKFTRKG